MAAPHALPPVAPQNQHPMMNPASMTGPSPHHQHHRHHPHYPPQPPPQQAQGNPHHPPSGPMTSNGPSTMASLAAMRSHNMTPHLPALNKLASINEQTWIQIGSLAEQMNDQDRALTSYEAALRHNPYSIPALKKIGVLCKTRNQLPRAVEYFQRILNIENNNGEIWGLLGHSYLLMDDLHKAYNAYQQALYLLPNANDAKLWYGIGILYDRYGSYEHAEEAFAASLRIDAKFEKAGEIYFRLGIIYKQLQKYSTSLECFQYILNAPPPPLNELDIYFQIGNVHEQQKEYQLAKEAYERVLTGNASHAKALQQLGWLYHQTQASFCNQDSAIQYMNKSLEVDGNDPQSWYLLGRCFMAKQNYNKAYEAYQQAVYRDGRNPTYWCSIGVLYYQINQYRDALDAYSRAIKLNPYISEVWYDLGTLYESCNNQISDALDAYQRAAELDPGNPHIQQRLQILKQSQQKSGGEPGSAPPPPPPPGYSSQMLMHPRPSQSNQVPASGLSGVYSTSYAAPSPAHPAHQQNAPPPLRAPPMHMDPPPPQLLPTSIQPVEPLSQEAPFSKYRKEEKVPPPPRSSHAIEPSIKDDMDADAIGALVSMREGRLVSVGEVMMSGTGGSRQKQEKRLRSPVTSEESSETKRNKADEPPVSRRKRKSTTDEVKE